MPPLADGSANQPPGSGTPRGEYARLIPWSGPALVSASFLALSVWTWRKWPDLLVDFGRELYVPWQLAAGKVLYADIAYFNGPLSPYVNSVWFRLFGVSITTLALSNLAVLAALTCLIHLTFRAACDRISATLVSVVFIGVFAFSQHTDTGNYNFISPYSHELTHGITLSVAMIYCLTQYTRRQQISLSILAGLLLGLVFLTKAEVFLAAAAAAGLGMGLLRISSRSRAHSTGVAALAFLGATFLPIASFYAFLSVQMPATEALRGIAGTWTTLLGSKVAAGPFYRLSMGLDQPGINLGRVLRMSAGIMLLAGAVVIADVSRGLPRRRRNLIRGAGVLAVVAALLIKPSPMPWLLAGWPLPVTTLAAGTVIAAVCIRRRVDHHSMARLAPLAMWSAFAFVLLGKIILYPRVQHYGFALAMPAALLLVACVVGLIPEVLAKSNGRGDLFRRLAGAMLAADIIFYLLISNVYYGRKYYVVGGNGDRIVTYGPHTRPQGVAVARVLRRIELVMPANATFVVLPEGVMLNYLARRVNPTPYLNFLPPEMTIFGEARILDSFKAHAPDFILLVHRDTSEYGIGHFGADSGYGKQIMEWVERQYVSVERIGEEPLRDEPSDIKILKRRVWQ